MNGYQLFVASQMQNFYASHQWSVLGSVYNNILGFAFLSTNNFVKHLVMIFERAHVSVGT